MQLFSKAAEIMFKKYMTSPGFKNLVKPVTASGLSSTMMVRLEVESPKKKKSDEGRKVKKCCS